MELYLKSVSKKNQGFLVFLFSCLSLGICGVTVVQDCNTDVDTYTLWFLAVSAVFC